MMFDAQCDLAALVYTEGENPDRVLHEFGSGLNENGYRAVGIVQLGRHRIDADVSAMLMPSGKQLRLHQELDHCSAGCRLDLGQLKSAEEQIAKGLAEGADLLVVNRFGRQERKGKGLAHLIERALGEDVPVVIAVPSHHFADWIKFTNGMTVKLHCDHESLDAWWSLVSTRTGSVTPLNHLTVCEVIK